MTIIQYYLKQYVIQTQSEDHGDKLLEILGVDLDDKQSYIKFYHNKENRFLAMLHRMAQRE